jgi:hypothetical protein
MPKPNAIVATTACGKKKSNNYEMISILLGYNKSGFLYPTSNATNKRKCLYSHTIYFKHLWYKVRNK